jgi:hypothetical protein
MGLLEAVAAECGRWRVTADTLRHNERRRTQLSRKRPTRATWKMLRRTPASARVRVHAHDACGVHSTPALSVGAWVRALNAHVCAWSRTLAEMIAQGYGRLGPHSVDTDAVGCAGGWVCAEDGAAPADSLRLFAGLNAQCGPRVGQQSSERGVSLPAFPPPPTSPSLRDPAALPVPLTHAIRASLLRYCFAAGARGCFGA